MTASATLSKRPGRAAIVLAAGKGTRMQSELPKVLHEVGGQPMLWWVLDAARRAGCETLFVVVGHGSERVREVLEAEDIVWVKQQRQLGTGHAVLQVRDQALRRLGSGDSSALVLSGDAPLIRPSTLERLFREAEGGWGAVAVADLREPGSLGRVLEVDGRLEGIVEVADASAEQLGITLVNSGHYAVRLPDLFEWLGGVQGQNTQEELYLTDAMVAVAGEQPVTCLHLDDECESWGINDRTDLSRVHRELNRRTVRRLQENGVTVLDPDRLQVSPLVKVAADCTLHSDVTLLGACEIGGGCVLHQGAWIKDSKLGSDVVVHPYSVLEGAVVESACSVGPFARLRPYSVLEREAKVGNFVEVKKTTLGRGAKASHLAYLGDAEIGAGANIGAGVVTCNYDGESKHPTTVGEGAFIGSDTMLVAPVKVGARSTTGAGSVITDEVPEDSLALGRARQRNLKGWKRRGKAADRE